MSLRHLPLLATLLTLPAVGTGRAVAQPAVAPCCTSVEEAQAAFEQGLESLIYRWRIPGKLEEAQHLLCQAACCLPEPDLRSTTVGILTGQYFPYLYLGRAYQRRGDHCHALKSFNLSLCLGEVPEGHNRSKDLDAWRNNSVRRRPPTREAFGRGLHSYTEGHWREAIEDLAEAFKAWDDDGEPPRLYGRWRTDKPYLPRYFLARALFQDGCVREAVALLRCSRLSECKLAGDPDEDPEAFLSEAEEHLARSAQEQEPEECDRWRGLAAEQSECCACARCET